MDVLFSRGSHGVQHLTKIVQKASTRLNRWKGQYLSKASITILIQSHLEALPAHTMQWFSLPQSIATQLNRIHRNFLWKNSKSNSDVPLIAWDTVCKPKIKGGMGLRRVESVNAAFQCKLAWRMINQDSSLWVQCLRAKYLAKCEFFQCTRKGLESLVWKSLLKCRQLLKQGLC